MYTAVAEKTASAVCKRTLICDSSDKPCQYQLCHSEFAPSSWFIAGLLYITTTELEAKLSGHDVVSSGLVEGLIHFDVVL